MASSAVVTVRIEPVLLAALKRKALREGRSVSAEVVRLVREGILPQGQSRSKPVRSMGMFADFEAPELDDLLRLRRRFSRLLRPAAATKRVKSR
jgi:hypothetical protein